MNHRMEAETILGNDPTPSVVLNSAEMTEYRKIEVEWANAHATLYLAEQQRIANLIAWTTANGANPIESVERQIEEGLEL